MGAGNGGHTAERGLSQTRSEAVCRAPRTRALKLPGESDSPARGRRRMPSLATTDRPHSSIRALADRHAGPQTPRPLHLCDPSHSSNPSRPCGRPSLAPGPPFRLDPAIIAVPPVSGKSSKPFPRSHPSHPSNPFHPSHYFFL